MRTQLNQNSGLSRGHLWILDWLARTYFVFACAGSMMTTTAAAAGDEIPAGTWLPEVTADQVQPDPAYKSIEALLKPLHGKMRLLVCGYRGAVLDASKSFRNGMLSMETNRWECTIRSSQVSKDPTGQDIEIQFKITEGVANSTGVAVTFDFKHWDTNNYVLIPASVYNGNRNRVEHRAYAMGLNREDLYKKDLELTTAELPQLSPEPNKISKIEVSTCNATTPAICFFNRKMRHGIIILTEQQTRFGDNGLMIEENRDRTQATFVVSAPGIRERKPEFIGFGKSMDTAGNWKSGDALTLRLRVFAFEARDVTEFLDKFFSVRKSVTGPNRPRNLIPFSEVSRLMSRRIDSRFHTGKDFQFYCPENAAWISFGWVGGLMNTFPMLALRDEERLERVSKTFDFAIPRAQGKAGYFYGALNHDGKCFGREGYDEFPEICLTRKNGDVLYWMIKQFQLLKAQGRANAIKPSWERSMEQLADAFVKTWKHNGQWGNFVNIMTGEVAVYNTTGGASAIGGLVLAANYFDRPQYLAVAKEAAHFYFERDVVGLGMTTGGCADILHNADAETAIGLLTSLMALYESTQEEHWLEKCRALAGLVSTWVVSYDYELPGNTELGRLGARLAGTVWASTQNKHGAPGFCTSSGDALFKLFRATGDLRYAELLRDVVHAHAEGIKPTGEITERLTYCDADSRGDRGSGSTGWTELNGFLMALELPGIYVRTDKEVLYVFDHVQAEAIQRSVGNVTLKITNPTSFDARVAVMVENGRQVKAPLGNTAFLQWPKIDVKAKTTHEVTLPFSK